MGRRLKSIGFFAVFFLYAPSVWADSHADFLTLCCQGKQGQFDQIARAVAERLGPERRSGLNEDEIVAFTLYALPDFPVAARQINQAIREKGQKLERFRPAIELLRSALEKLPDQTGTVYRGVTLPAKALEHHVPGAVVTYEAFTSAALEPSVAWGWPSGAKKGYGQHHLTIRSAHGKNITRFVPSKFEEEILFRPMTRFQVLERRDYGDGVVEITLRELP